MVMEESPGSAAAAAAAVADGNVVDSENEEENENLEEEKEDEEEEEEDGEEDEFQLTFQGEMNPLDFTENDAFGLQPYEQLERLEYEALAERKRKALTDCQSDSAKKSRVDDSLVTSIEEIMEGMNINRRRRKSRKLKKKGRRKRSKKKTSPEVDGKLTQAIFCYAKGQYEEAIRVLKEVVLLEPNLSETYHRLGLVYEEIGDETKAMNFYMLSAHLEPKDPLWKRLFAFSIKQGNIGQARYCLEKAIKADPEDAKLRLNLATLYAELGDWRKAADSYHQIVQHCPEDVDARQMAAKMYQKCNKLDQAILILEDYVKDHSTEADFTLVCLLVGLLIENNAHVKALQQIEHVRAVYFPQKQLPLDLTVKAGICQVHLGNIEEAEMVFRYLEMERADNVANLIIEAATTLMNLGHYQLALKYYMMLEEYSERVEGIVHLNVGKCYLSLTERAQAITFYYKALNSMEENVDVRITLASLLVEEGKEDEAIALLSPPKHLESATNICNEGSRTWWASGKIKMFLARLYHSKGLNEEFVDAILPSVCEALSVEYFNQKIRPKRKLPKSVLFERVKVLGDNQVDFMFRGFRPLAPPSELSKGIRAKKLLQIKAAKKEEKRAAALAAGLEWKSDDSDSDDDYPRVPRISNLPNLLKDDEHYQLILDLCKALSSLRRYWEALRIVKDAQNLACDTLSFEKKEELRSLEVQVAYNISDPTFAFEDARSTVREHPYSIAAWNYYYKVISRSEKNMSKPSKFLNHMKRIHPKCAPPIIISGHKLTMISQHQAAARNYLQAFKLQPDSPLLNLCVGTALISLTFGFRLQKKHQCLAQGFAFLHNNLRLTDNSQEALYNIARAYHHVGLLTLAVIYYERALATPETDYPVPKIAIEASNVPESPAPGSCNLRREAAYNLHQIYKKSGALDLARQVLRNHCTV